MLVPTGSPVHVLPAHTKLVALPALAACVVLVPAGAWWALGACAVLLLAVVALARLPPGRVARRMLVEVPFVVFALLLPLVATGPRVDVLGLELSRSGLVGGGTLLAKATLGVLAAVVLAATTTSRDLLAGLDRLRLPRTMVAILGFAVRYSVVLVQDSRRLGVARAVRGGGDGRLRHLRAVAAGAGTLFVRSYERGERVQRAMLVRGWTGAMPALESRPATGREWLAAGAAPALALVIALAARVGA
ncbi:cobalt ECF transporter T component CbiQ [Pseudokineococcus basanitobsidens]|uniref:cobalt ECF transporter T component CbiQ n=1 Tax=Pseudokineococcus basanitobsidens TaxID=1926649 RepID=UPI003BB655A1